MANWKGSLNPKWNGGRIKHKGYVEVHMPEHPRRDSIGYVSEHLLVAEKALGKYIKSPACIHHGNEARGDNRNHNLVICQDNAYHKLLHMRKKALEKSGNANNRKCKYCKKYDSIDNMIRQSVNKNSYYHRCCVNKYQRGRLARKYA